MRIVQLTPGTGSFYCGTCLRDNALVAALRRLGHEAFMVPLYLPPALDEAAASDRMPVFYGGLNVYLQQHSSLFRRIPRWLDRLLDSPALLRATARRAGATQPRQLGELTLSTLQGEEGNQAKELERLTDWLVSEGPIDVVCLSNALLIGLARRIREKTEAAVVCTLQGEDYFLDLLPEPFRTQAWDTLVARAAEVDAFVAVSHYYAGVMRTRAHLPADRMHVVYNGIALDGYPQAPRTVVPQPPVLGYLSRMCPLKGLHTLVEAYVLLRERRRIPDLRLRIAGTQTADDIPFVTQLQDRLTGAGLADAVEFLPNLDREKKLAFLKGLSLLSVPATYGESFGLYLLEAWAAGVAVVQPRHAAFPELIEATGGGVLCEPDNPEALADAIETLLCDSTRLLQLGEKARQAVRTRFHVDVMAQNVLHVFEQAVARRRG